MGSPSLPPTAVFTSFPPHAESITPSDSTVFDVASTVFVGTAGVVRVKPARPANATPVNFTCQDGTYVPVLVVQVLETQTTATNLVRVF